MSDRRVVLFLFVGREKNLRVQMPYWHRLLADWPGLTIELWNMCRNESDDRFVRSLATDRIMVRNELYEPNDWPKGVCRRRQARPRWCGCQECKPGQFERPYAIYADDPSYADVLFVKADDDIMFWQTETFGHLFETLDNHPNAVVSARVVNNVVSAKHTPGLRAILENRFAPQTQRQWFDLHTSSEFAEICHDWFLFGGLGAMPHHLTVTRALPGERPSINTIAFTHETMRRLAAVMAHPKFKRMGDEGAVCQNFLPRIVSSFTTAHLQFGPQRVKVPEERWDQLRAAYTDLATRYLG